MVDEVLAGPRDVAERPAVEVERRVREAGGAQLGLRARPDVAGDDDLGHARFGGQRGERLVDPGQHGHHRRQLGVAPGPLGGHRVGERGAVLVAAGVQGGGVLGGQEVAVGVGDQPVGEPAHGHSLGGDQPGDRGERPAQHLAADRPAAQQRAVEVPAHRDARGPAAHDAVAPRRPSAGRPASSSPMRPAAATSSGPARSTSSGPSRAAGPETETAHGGGASAHRDRDAAHADLLLAVVDGPAALQATCELRYGG